MPSEAERMIRVSVEKLDRARASRVSTSLLKELLVAKVLHKARFMFIEESIREVYNLPEIDIHPTPLSQQHLRYKQELQEQRNPITQESFEDPGYFEEVNIMELTANLSGLTSSELQDEKDEWSTFDNINQILNNSSDNCFDDNDKENCASSSLINTEITYEKLNKSAIKRTLAVTEWETEQAVLSILPKRSRQEDSDSDEDDSAFIDLDDADIFDWTDREFDADETDFVRSSKNDNNTELDIETMDIEIITL